MGRGPLGDRPVHSSTRGLAAAVPADRVLRARRRPGNHLVAIGAHALTVDNTTYSWSDVASVRLLPERDPGVRQLVVEPDVGRIRRYLLHITADEDERLEALLDQACPSPDQRSAERRDELAMQDEFRALRSHASERVQ